MQAILTMGGNTGNGLDKHDHSAHANSLLGGLMAVLVTTVIVAGSLWMMKPATLPIKHVHIEGKFLRLDTNRMQELVSDKVRGGFFNINVAAIRNTLMALPWVKEVSVHRIWPDGLRVVVNEQTAVVRWNETGLLNDQGHYFAPDKDSFPNGLPMLDGPEDSQKLLLDRFNLLKQFHGLSVVHLRLNERRAWQFELDSGLSVVLGRKDFESRIDRFVYMVIKNMGEKLSQAKEIDMRYTNGFAVRWKQRAIENIESGVK
ncbi:MAG: cell division protein FtsQ/DivIB [Proteobacteria bacterium]|nr:cell division protein FtsQ/DivIB [Pseudomonadota bacterium]